MIKQAQKEQEKTDCITSGSDGERTRAEVRRARAWRSQRRSYSTPCPSPHVQIRALTLLLQIFLKHQR